MRISRDLHDRCLRACWLLRVQPASPEIEEKLSILNDVATAWAISERPWIKNAVSRARAICDEMRVW